MKGVRMSRIIEHNQNTKTDKLYDPLRGALSKSISGKKKLTLSPKVIEKPDVKWSRVSRQIHELSPEQAIELQNNIYIPTTKKLNPTSNVNKISGKSFTAIDMNVSYGKPISENELRQRRFNQPQAVQKIVYQMDEDFQMRNNKNQNPQNQLIQLRNSNKYKTKNNEKGEPLKRAIPVQLRNKAIYDSRTKVKTEGNTETNLRGSILPEKKDEGWEGLKKLSNASTKHSKKQKQQYKYNLFSAIDEATNTKCETCGSNEMIASKPRKQKWS